MLTFRQPKPFRRAKAAWRLAWKPARRTGRPACPFPISSARADSSRPTINRRGDGKLMLLAAAIGNHRRDGKSLLAKNRILIDILSRAL